jgi:hypothetical protein
MGRDSLAALKSPGKMSQSLQLDAPLQVQIFSIPFSPKTFGQVFVFHFRIIYITPENHRL